MAAKSLLRILELFPGPALLVGSGGEVVGYNDRAEAWSGLRGDELHGRGLAGVVADEPPGRVAGFLDECARGAGKAAETFATARGEGAGGEWRLEGVAVPSDREGEPALVAVHAVRSAPGAGAVGAAPGCNREAELGMLRDEVRRKDEFLGRLAHDLRNPVAAISGALHLARTATAEDDVAWAADAMERQLKHLVQRLDDLLDLSRLGRGKIELQRQRLDAAAVVRAAAAVVRPLVDERRHQFTVSISPGPLTVDADPTRLEQALVGLLNHAARTTEPGGCIRISAATEAGWVVLRVRDSGPGISPEMLPWVFDQSGQGGPSDIGLSLVRRLAELHGGSASVQSDGPGKGSEFTVRVPTASDAAAAPAGPMAEQPAGGGSDAAGTRILVVDDNVDTARGIARLLELAGHQVWAAHDGRQALEIAREVRPQLVLLDIVLPVMDGQEVARRLRDDPRHQDAVIIAISGYGEDDEARSHGTGFDHHMVKPIDHESLRALIIRAMGPDARRTRPSPTDATAPRAG